MSTDIRFEERDPKCNKQIDIITNYCVRSLILLFNKH